MLISPPDVKGHIRERLEAVRRTTLELFESVPDEFLRRRVHSFYSPIGWHFGHVGRTEEFWVCQATGQAPCDEDLSFLYADLLENPKDNRVNIPDREGTIAYLAKTREVALRALDEAELSSDNPLIKDGYAWEFAIQHECQHQETITEMLCLIHKELGPLEVECASWKAAVGTEFLDIPGGHHLMGSEDPYSYDNERPIHEVHIQPFLLAKTPVTAFQWSRFMADGGYHRPELWSHEGWRWRTHENVEAPEYWVSQENGQWAQYGMSGVRAMHPDEPATCLSWFEADAFARWSEARLPTEDEWEYAASGLVERIYPWGDTAPSATMANHGRIAGGPMPVDTCSKGASPFGALDMAGNCWEWTSSPFLPYPGFAAFPYDGYSKDHMDGHHFVCRGGSWATAGPILRCSFRNWYVPSYRQGFLGLRLAR
ncbi:MAG: SUMF1/EgtB/PvdO family nonheme iron enzyme [Fimbriimonas sp.]